MAGQAGTVKPTMKQPAKPQTKAPAAAPAPVSPDQTREERLVAWLTANAKTLGIIAGAIALVVVIVLFMAASNRRKEAFARQALENAWGLADAGNVPQASAELQRIATTYRGTDAAVEARLSLNQTRLVAGQNQLAVDDLRQMIGDGLPARFQPSANMLLASGLENLARPAEAAEAFMAAANAAQLDHQKAEALLGAARSYRAAGQTDRAREIYQTIVTDHRETAAFPIAEVRLGELSR
jgi:predicted negative regulator of RcsB-dependent stress response